MPHTKPANYGLLRPQMKIVWKPSIEWPFCWVCWVPLRQPCNHEPPVKGHKHDPLSCPYQVLDPFSHQPSPIIPTLITLIFCYYFYLEQGKKNDLLPPIANFLGISVGNLTRFRSLLSWLQVLPQNPSDVPNAARFLLAWQHCYLSRNELIPGLPN